MLAESENVTSPMRVEEGSVSFPSAYKESISKPRNVVISRMVSSPMLPELSTAITMSDPREQSTDNSYDVAEVAVFSDDDDEIWSSSSSSSSSSSPHYHRVF